MINSKLQIPSRGLGTKDADYADFGGACETRNPKPETRNSESETSSLPTANCQLHLNTYAHKHLIANCFLPTANISQTSTRITRESLIC